MPPRAAAFLRTLIRLAVAVALAVLSLWLLDRVRDATDAMPGPGGRVLYLAILGAALAGYAVLLALPFVPGVEVGIAVLAMQGAAAAPAVYLATLAGLMLAFGAGRHLPPRWIAGALDDLGLRRAYARLTASCALPAHARLARLPVWARGPVLRHAGLALAVNLPGNAVLGGGGGLLLMAGLSGLFRAGPVLATLAVAVAPVPLAVWTLGWTFRAP